MNRLPLELKGVETGTECQGKTVTLSIVADNDTTNGVYTVAYDASKVTFTGKSGLVDYTSFSDRDGVVTFAYAAKDAVPAGTTLATLTFTAEADTEATFTITTVEEGRNKPGTSETLTVTVPEHDYIVSVVPATCTEGGYTLYTCRNCGSNYKDHFTEALGHDWSEWTVTEAADCFHAGSETRTCARCEASEIRTIAANSDNCPSKAFKDVDINRWYHKGIDFVVTQGLMEGVGDGLFLPNGNLTRGQMVTILYRLAGQPEISGKSPFTDVQEGRFYADAVVWAAENGIVKGVTEELFVPNRFVTREEMVTMLARYAELNGVEITTRAA